MTQSERQRRAERERRRRIRIMQDPALAAAYRVGCARRVAQMKWRRQQGESGVQHAVALVAKLASAFRVSQDEREELESVGLIGAAQAYRQFDPRKKVPFGAYATLRIRGVMKDELERIARRRKFEQQLDGRIAV